MLNCTRRTILVALLAVALSPTAEIALAAPATVDAAIPAYVKVAGVSGNLNSIGSDTMNNLMTLWAEGFQKHYPGVRIQVEGKGSSTAPPALIAGTAQLGPMSREMKATEVDQFEAKFSYKPLQLRVAIDALAVYVNKDNPLEQLSLPQVDAIFSKGRACGAANDLRNWSDLGVTGSLAARPISMYGRNSASGTYGFFKSVALCEGDFKDTVKEQPGSASVVQGITEDVNAIGYSGMGYSTSGVRPLKLAKKDGGPYVDTATENVYSGKYPLARALYVYANQGPGGLDPLTKEFLRFILSRDGQEIVVKDGYLPLPAKIVATEAARLK